MKKKIYSYSILFYSILFYSILFYSILLLVFIALGYLYQNVIKKNIFEESNFKKYQPSYEYKSGKDLLFIYFGSPFCGYCNSPEMPKMIEKSKFLAKAVADSTSANFTTQGVAISWSPEKGYDHLSKFGNFDELTLGRSRFNSSSLKYIHIDLPSDEVGKVPLVTREIIFKKGEKKIPIKF